MTLRAFLLRSLAGFAVLVVSPWAVAGSPARRLSQPLSGLNFESFAEELGSEFRVPIGEPGGLALRLIRAERQKPSLRSNPNGPDAAFEKFSLVFAGSRTHQLTQETYTFAHPRLGRCEMFIVPVGTLDPAVHKYEAVFSRLPTA